MTPNTPTRSQFIRPGSNPLFPLIKQAPRCYGMPDIVFGADQFLVLSTILPAEIHGIIARSFSPTCSI